LISRTPGALPKWTTAEHYRPFRDDHRGCLAKRERNDHDAKSRLVERNEALGIRAGMGCVASSGWSGAWTLSV
jgi:hypothetical protein